MPGPLVAIFHQAPRDGDAPLTRLLAEARSVLLAQQLPLFERAGADRWRCCPVATRRWGAASPSGSGWCGCSMRNPRRPRPHRDGQRRGPAAANPGCTPSRGDRAPSPDAWPSPTTATRRTSAPSPTQGRFTSCRPSPPTTPCRAGSRRSPVSRSASCPAVTGWRWTSTRHSTWRCWRLARGVPAPLRRLAAASGIAIPRLDELRQLAADPRRELLVAGRSGSRTLHWLERNVKCRVRFLSEERGLRASPATPARPVRASAACSPRAVRRPCQPSWPSSPMAPSSTAVCCWPTGWVADEAGWPSPEDRFASDLLRPDSHRRRVAGRADPRRGQQPCAHPAGRPHDGRSRRAAAPARPAATVTRRPGDVRRLR